MNHRFRTFLRSCILVLATVIFAGAATAQPGAPAVLLISFDGFRNDYIDKHDLPNFKAFRAAGTSAEGLIPCYPSLTFPNHYSIVTGQRPATHGLVDNSFYDSLFDVSHSISNRAAVTDPRLYGGTPLWVLAKAGGLKTASYFWVGSEVSDPSRRPDTYFPYDAKVPFISRIDTVLAWLRRPEQSRPRFITLYFAEPDHTAHEAGPESGEIRQVLHGMDSLLGYLMAEIRKINTPVNTIIVSDHGMSDLTVADETYIFLDELYDVKTTRFKTVTGGTLAHLYINKKSTIDSMFSLLRARQSNYKVYRKPEFPSHWQYNHYRIGDVVIVPDPGHNLRLSDRKSFNQRVKPGSHFGVHGYDPTVVTEMRGIFLAQGPQIKKGMQLGLVRNIDIYPLIASILKLKIPGIDGDPEALKSAYTGR